MKTLEEVSHDGGATITEKVAENPPETSPTPIPPPAVDGVLDAASTNGTPSLSRTRKSNSGRRKTTAPEQATPLPNQQALEFSVDNEIPENVDAPAETTARGSEIYDDLFASTLLGLASIEGLGRKGITALLKTVGDDNSQLVWELDQSTIEAVLHKVKVPASQAIAQVISDNRDALIEKGQVEVDRLAQDLSVMVIPLRLLPESMRNSPSPPPWLFVQGNPQALYARPMVAIVGTRDATEDGKRATKYVVDMLAAYPMTIVSGLANGIDAVAHQISLRRNCPNIAFLGHGIQFEFPAETRALRRQIIEQEGAVATEYLPYEKWEKSYFVQRNRLQAALADLVIPVEAHADGGTAHTVRFARDYNRPTIGISWPGANGIVPVLAKAGHPIIPIFEREGRKNLDRYLREVLRPFVPDFYCFAAVERQIINEIESRDIQPSELRRMIAFLEQQIDKLSVSQETFGDGKIS